MAQDTGRGLRNKVIYSLYVRNNTTEGALRAARKDLARIRELGVDIVWLLPVHPIGEKARKGELGSPYANKDYRAVNPELGTKGELVDFVAEVRRLGMKCIMDVVYNHTSPDSELAATRPEWFYFTPEGRHGNRIGDWGDIVDLDYSHDGLWDYQIETLKEWAGLVDGFRCDVAPLVPLAFWKRARAEVARVNPECLWLAESVEPGFVLHLRERGLTGLSDGELLQAFDICYDYDTYPAYAAYLEGKLPLGHYLDQLNAQEHIYPDNYVKLRFLENHDRPRARRLIPDEGDLINWTAFLYFLKGAPLIYGGQEMQHADTPDLFGRQPVVWDRERDLSPLFRSLYALKQEDIMAFGQCRLQTAGADTVSGLYVWGTERLAGFFRLKGSRDRILTDLPDGEYRNLVDGSGVRVKAGVLQWTGTPVIVKYEDIGQG